VSGGLAGTEAAAKVLRDTGFGGTLAVIAQLGVDPERFRPDSQAGACLRARLGIPSGAFVIGYGGRLVPEKGLPVLLEAVARLSPAQDGGPFLIVLGSGPERDRLQSLASRLGIGPRVRFVEQVPSTQVPLVLAGFDTLVLSSVSMHNRNEQFGRILVEAMAAGVPVIGTRVGEIPKVVGDAGDIVGPEDSEQLAGALRRVMTDEGLRAHHSQRGRARVLEHFTQTRIAERTVAFYRRLLEPGATT
jgi:glycosyltransferase involved in cell wall biosynthesis